MVNHCIEMSVHVFSLMNLSLSFSVAGNEMTTWASVFVSAWLYYSLKNSDTKCNCVISFCGGNLKKKKMLARTNLLVVLVQGISSSPFATQHLSVSVYIHTFKVGGSSAVNCWLGAAHAVWPEMSWAQQKDIKMGSWHLSVGSVNSFPFISIKNLNIAKKCFTATEHVRLNRELHP